MNNVISVQDYYRHSIIKNKSQQYIPKLYKQQIAKEMKLGYMKMLTNLTNE